MIDDTILQNIVLDQVFLSWSIIGRMSRFELILDAYKEHCETSFMEFTLRKYLIAKNY